MNNTTTSNIAFKSGIWYVISSILVKGIVILTTPIFTRILSTKEYGIVANFNSWSSLLLVICTLNLTYSIGRAKLDFPSKLNKYVGAMQLLSLIFSLCLCSIILIFLDIFSYIMELEQEILFFLMLYLIFSPTILFVQNSYRYEYKYKQNIAIAWYTSISTVSLSILLILFINKNKALLRILGIVLPTIFLSVFFWFKQLKNRYINFNPNFIIYGLKLSGPLVLHTLSLNLLAQSDIILITRYCGANNTAIYSLAYSYGILLTTITNAIAEGWLPWFHDTFYNNQYNIIQEKVKPLIGLGCFLGLGCISLAPEIILILGGKEYISGIYCIPPIVLGIVCQYVYTHYVNIELHLKKTFFVSLGTIFAAILNIILNIIFIPKYGFAAAAYTTLFGYIFLLISHYYISNYILTVKLYNNIFMFAAILVTSICSIILALSYQYIFLRFILTTIGLLVFISFYKEYIKLFLKNNTRKRK